MIEESTFSDFYHKARKKVLKKKDDKKKKKHQYPAGASGRDAGVEAKKVLKNKERHEYVNNIRDFDDD